MERKKQNKGSDFRKPRQGGRFDLTDEQIQLQKEINMNTFTPISFEVYKKSAEEKSEAKDAKIAHKYLLKSYGYDYTKVMNIPQDKSGAFISNRK